MKNIIFKVNSLDIGGVERLAIDTMNLLEEEGFDMFLILDASNNFLENQLNKGIKKYYLSDLKLFKFYKSLELNRKKSFILKIIYEIFKIGFNKYVQIDINRILKKEKIEVFIDYSGEYKRHINRIKCKKKIIWQHASIIGTNKKKLKKYGKRISKYDLIVCVCDELKEEILGLFPNLEKKIIKIYNFIDENRINNLKNDYFEITEKERRMLKKDYFVSLGRLSEGKGYQTTIRAFEELLKKGYDERLYIIGEGEFRSQLEKMIKEKKLDRNIFLLGKKENPYIWLKNSKSFIHSSYKEGFGLVLVEAMICGTSVISSNYKCGSKEILKNGEIGILYKVKDYLDLGYQLEKFIKNNKLNMNDKQEIEKEIKKFYKSNAVKKFKTILKDKTGN